jgi:hypothetical protein
MGSRVEGPREARAAVVALRSLDVDVRKSINAQSRSAVTPMWTSVVEANATTHMDTRVLALGARVQTGYRVTLVAASSRRRLRGGLIPADRWQGYEFGAVHGAPRTYETRSRKGRTYKVTRRTTEQLPKLRPSGRVLYPSVADIGPRVFALATQTAIRGIFDAYQRGEV